MAFVKVEEKSLPEIILTWLLQVLGAITAILFGTFGVLSWQVAGEANRLTNDANQLADDANGLTNESNGLADTANMLALLQVCGGVSGTNVSFSALCDAIIIAAESTISEIASSYFPDITPTIPDGPGPTTTITSTSTSPPIAAPTPTSTSTGLASRPGSHLSGKVELILGLTIGSAVIVVLISALTFWRIRNVKKRTSLGQVGESTDVLSKNT